MSTFSEPPQNPFRNPDAKPQWAELARLAGDRAAILFEELRKRIGDLENLQEELHYAGPELGWVPRYRVGEMILFTAHVLPGVLEVTMDLDEPLRERIMASPVVAREMKDSIRSSTGANGQAVARLRLSNASTVRSFAKVVHLKFSFSQP